MFTAIKRDDFSSLLSWTVLLQIQCLMGRFGIIDIKRDQAVDNTLADTLRNLPTSDRSRRTFSAEGLRLEAVVLDDWLPALDRF